MHNTKEMKIEVGYVVLTKGDEKNKGKWSIGLVEELYQFEDDVSRSGYKHRKVTHRTTNPVFASSQTLLRYRKTNK